VGLGAGGLVGQWLLERAPERINHAVLANTGAYAGGAEIWNERIRTAHEKGVEALAPSLIENWFTRHFREHHPEEVRHIEAGLLGTSAEGYAAAAAAVRDADMRGGLHAIRHPVLVIVGRHDPVAPPGVGALIASSVKGARLVTLEAAQLSPVEAAQAFNHALLEFLKGRAEKPADAAKETEHHAPTAHEAPPKKPRKPRAPRPKPGPVVAEEHHETAHEPEHAPAPAIKKPAPKPAAKPAASPAEPAAARATPRKRAAKKSAARKVAAKKAAKQTARRAAAKKRPVRKPAAKKHAVKRAAMKKRPAKKAVRKIGRKAAAKKASRKGTAKRRAAKKSPMKRSMRKMGAKRRPARRGGR